MWYNKGMIVRLWWVGILAVTLLLSIFILRSPSPPAAQVGRGEAGVLAEVAAGAATLLDVRTPEEWDAGRATEASHFELARLTRGESPGVPRDSKIYLYCRTGSRAEQAKRILSEQGFTNVTNLGGLTDWEAMGGAVTR